MTTHSPALSLPYIMPAQAQKHVTHNEAITLLDALVQTVAQSRNASSPPSLPETGDCYLVAVGGVDDWAGRDLHIAVFDGFGWQFLDPRPGWRVYVLDEARGVVWTGSDWQSELSELNNIAGIGVNATADTINRLSVSAEASLLSHEGAGHQLKINKSAPADTASLLFQTGWSGRAEMGTTGSDAFAIKVSPDGANWSTALSFDAATGHVTGAAVQTTATDTTPGRIMRADYGFSRGNLLGAVGQTGGVPTGAVIERGSNANGDYVRFADGLQICTVSFTMPDLTNASGSLFMSDSFNWAFPAAFAALPSLSGTGGATIRWLGGLPANNVVASMRIMSTVSSAAPVTGNAMAIGRWF